MDKKNLEQNDKFSVIINDLIDKRNKATTDDEKWKWQFMIDCCSYNPETNTVEFNTRNVFYHTKGIYDILDMIAYDRAIKNIELKDSLNDSVKHSVKHSVNDIIMNRIKSVYSIIKRKFK